VGDAIAHSTKDHFRRVKALFVSKKSQLGLLGYGQGKQSDVVHHVGGFTSDGRGGYDIYIDQTDNSDIGEILVVRKKSRAGLEGWLGACRIALAHVLRRIEIGPRYPSNSLPRLC
jgi:hypothetical protein